MIGSTLAILASATLPKKMKEHGIQGMLQLYQPIDNKALDCKFIGLQDGVPITSSQIKEGIAFIHDQRKKKHHLLSTCGAGISRSVTMAIVALKRKLNAYPYLMRIVVCTKNILKPCPIIFIGHQSQNIMAKMIIFGKSGAILPY